jgi:hypothetical protein
VGKNQRDKTVSETSQESQTHGECCVEGQNICCGKETLGEGQGCWQEKAVSKLGIEIIRKSVLWCMVRRRSQLQQAMPPELVKVGLPATIALVGTIITAVFGYRQWKRQQRTPRHNALLDERAQAYKELWEKLEEIHVGVRGRQPKSAQFSQMIRDVNAFAMKHGLHIDDQDRELATQYLAAVYDYCIIISESKDKDAMREGFETTHIRKEVLDRVQRLGPAQEKVRTLRDQIISRFKAVIEIEA